MHPFINTAVKAAIKSGDIIAKALERRDELEVGTKSKNNFVTQVDIASEEQIVETLLKAYPDHAVLGEEGGLQGATDSDYQWIIDPLDGTNNFIHGYPHLCISIALKFKNRVEYGVVYDPIRNDLYCAVYGRGAQKNNRRIRVNNTMSLDTAMIGTVLHASKLELREPFFDATKHLFGHCANIRIAGAAALDLCFVAAGHLDGFWSIGLQSWDMAAASLIIKESGGVVIDFNGGENYLHTGNIIAANTKIIKQLVEHLKDMRSHLR